MISIFAYPEGTLVNEIDLVSIISCYVIHKETNTIWFANENSEIVIFKIGV